MPRLKRPSPALVVSIIALVAAVAVPAFALTKSEKRVVRKVANAQITKRAPGLAVASAQSAASASNAANAAKVDDADVCSGTVSMQSTDAQTVCSVGPLSVVANCLVGNSDTRARLDLVSSGDAWAFGERIDAPAAEEPIAETSLSSPFTIAEAMDSNASSLVLDGSGAWVSAGAPGGASLSGEFSARANHTGTDQGTCLISTGAIAG
jgi:hypothetical protein